MPFFLFYICIILYTTYVRNIEKDKTHTRTHTEDNHYLSLSKFKNHYMPCPLHQPPPFHLYCSAACRALPRMRTAGAPGLISSSSAKMAKDNFIFAQCILYFLAFVFGFIAVVPLSENTEDFRGKCLLFTRGMWQNENITVSKQRFIIEEWGPQSSCSFITIVGIASLVLSAVQAWRLLFFICKGHDE